VVAPKDLYKKNTPSSSSAHCSPAPLNTGTPNMSVEPDLNHSLSPLSKHDEVPQELHRAMWRLKFPSSYVVVGAYRLFTDNSLYIPAWNKCRNGVRRGLICGFAWVNLNLSFFSIHPCLTAFRSDLHVIQHPAPHYQSSPHRPLFHFLPALYNAIHGNR
jgi:hypothetical protein